METTCKFDECTMNCSEFAVCNSEKKLKLACFRHTRRRIWESNRRYSFFTRFQKRCNENTVFYSGG